MKWLKKNYKYWSIFNYSTCYWEQKKTELKEEGRTKNFFCNSIMWSILQLVKFFVTTVSYEKMLVFFFLFHFSPNIKQEITMYVDLVLNSQYQTPEGFTEWPVATYKQNKIHFFFLTKALLSSIYHKKEKKLVFSSLS